MSLCPKILCKGRLTWPSHYFHRTNFDKRRRSRSSEIHSHIQHLYAQQARPALVDPGGLAVPSLQLLPLAQPRLVALPHPLAQLLLVSQYRLLGPVGLLHQQFLEDRRGLAALVLQPA